MEIIDFPTNTRFWKISPWGKYKARGYRDWETWVKKRNCGNWFF